MKHEEKPSGASSHIEVLRPPSLPDAMGFQRTPAKAGMTQAYGKIRFLVKDYLGR